MQCKVGLVLSTVFQCANAYLSDIFYLDIWKLITQCFKFEVPCKLAVSLDLALEKFRLVRLD